jgi:hypothetical protein
MIRLELPWLPPSSNAAYFNLPGKGRALTSVGRKFLTQTKAHLVQRYPKEMMFFKKNTPYFMGFGFIFEHIENVGFSTGKAQTRYKHFDGGNRTKLLEDALKDAGGIDDSQTLASIWVKSSGLPERTIIIAWSPDVASTPLDEAFGLLRR